MKNLLSFSLASVITGSNLLHAPYDFEAGMASQEKADGKVTNPAIENAKKEMEEDELRKQTRIVKNTLDSVNSSVANAEKLGRFSSKLKNILKEFSENLKKTQEGFEKDGDCKKCNTAIEELRSKKEEAIAKAKLDIYGDRWESIRF